jgi:hypothetical protein
MTTTVLTRVFPLVLPFLVIIDSSVEDIPILLAGVRSGGTAIVLEPDRDGTEQITAALRSQPGMTALHIISHGAPGQICLGNSVLSTKTLHDLEG